MRNPTNFNFGRELGPTDQSDGPIGKFTIRIVKIPASPLEPEHTVITGAPFEWDDFWGDNYGGSGSGGGGGGSGDNRDSGGLGGGIGRGGRAFFPPPAPAPPKCRPKGYVCDQVDCCSKQQQSAIEQAFNKIIALPCLNPQAFPTLTRDLIEAFTKRVTVRCIQCTSSTSYRAKFDAVDGSGKTINELVICDDQFTGDPDKLASAILHELIHAAGGNEIDAVSIVDHCFCPKKFEDISNYFAEIASNRSLYPVVFDNVNNTNFVQGRYVNWYPRDGIVVSKVGNYNNQPQYGDIVIDEYDSRCGYWNWHPTKKLLQQLKI